MVQVVPPNNESPTSSMIVDIRDGEYVAVNGLRLTRSFARLLVEFIEPTSSSARGEAVFNGPCTSLQYRPRDNWLRSGTAPGKS